MSDQPTTRVVTVSDPAAEAAAYAQRLGADVARDRDAVERAIAERVEAARALGAGAGADDADVIARGEAIRAAAGAAPLGDVELARLRELAAELARAERIRAHTERRVAEVYPPVAPPPAPGPVVDEARRAAAEAVAAADAALDAAVAALDAAEAAVLSADPSEANLPRDRGSEPADRAAGSDGVASGWDEVEAWEAALVAKETAEARADAARRQWHELAGADADPRDPQALLVEAPAPPAAAEPTSPTLAAVAAFHRKIQARWRVQWAAVGGGEPPEPEHLDVAIDGLDGRRRRAAGDLVRLEAAERRAVATAVIARPLVVVEPREWAAADDLGQLLGRLPGTAQVIVIERRWAS